MGVGQFCTNPGVIVLQSSPLAEQFVKDLATKLAGTPPAAMLTAGICVNFRKGVETRAHVPGVKPVGASLLATALPEASRASSLPPNAATPVWFETDAATFLGCHSLSEEIFGPSSLVVWCQDRAGMLEVARHLEGNLTATLHAGAAEAKEQGELIDLLAAKAGRVILNGYPTGLEVSHAIVHGGPYPATSDGGRSTSVGTRALHRWTRLVCFQGFTDDLLPPELQNANPLGLLRQLNGEWTSEAVR
jgi:NADP-dependent aldehyde dehydrogenase